MRAGGGLDVQVASLSTPPMLLVDERGLRVWHKLDRTYRIPKASAFFRVPLHPI